ncbi:helix-turn-helix domain-containing protein [Devosia sp.]|uniref:helix-turn-helix domain-containing protein n=1 Tax=Devosia sp. TaxID=1871048 RepID=UPI0037BF8AB4
MPDILLKTRDVAERLGVHPATVLRRQGELGVVKLNGRVLRFPESSVASFIESHRPAMERAP